MNDELNEKKFFHKQHIDWLELSQKVFASRIMILKVCCIGAILGIAIFLSIPPEYTASMFLVHESSRKRISTLAEMGDDMGSSITTGRDAIYPSLYLDVINSTPFLLRLFEVKVHEQKDTSEIPLALYIAERQKRPWWNIVVSAPSKLVGLGMSLFSPLDSEQEIEMIKVNIRKTPFRLTRKEVAIARAIASRINIVVDKKKRTIALSVTMQDPQIAATVADTVQAFVKEYMTEYRTSKARRVLEYYEMLRKDAQTEYNKAQDKYSRYADANRNLVMLSSRSELSNLQNEMMLALTTYNQMDKQVQVAEARVEKVAPVYTVIQPVTVPLYPSKPNKLGILAACVLLGGVGCIGWILFAKYFIRKIKITKQRINQC